MVLCDILIARCCNGVSVASVRLCVLLSAVYGCSRYPACIKTAPLENRTWVGLKIMEDRERETLPKDEPQRRCGVELKVCRTPSSKSG